MRKVPGSNKTLDGVIKEWMDQGGASEPYESLQL